jgi:hypothetical protein
MWIILSPVTAVIVKNSISHKLSLTVTNSRVTNENITDVLPKKPLTIRHPNGFIMLFQMLNPLLVIRMETVMVKHSPYDRTRNVHLSKHTANTFSQMAIHDI